jgi:maltooligosyltrehalose trehalohydrolase
VTQQLARLRKLGVTAIELMPIADFSGTRNWGYDGVLPFAPDSAYGTPGDLKRLVDTAHDCNLNIYLDVVYNHFGPDGNFLHAYAPQFFRDDLHTPWGAAIDFRRREVRQFFIHNALYWLLEYRFDGLRFDAVHAIQSDDFLDELARTVRQSIAPDREVHLMLENEKNESRLLRDGNFDAQWNDDFHNSLHVVLTGEREGYYANYVDAPAQKLARCLAEGFAFQGEPSPSHANAPRGTPSADLPPTRFIAFVQNHDQVGNRAMGERLITLVEETALRAAIVVQLLAPHVPMLFMGEERGARAPFLFFTDFHDALADAVREGRRKEFAKFAAFADAARREQIPDPNAQETFCRSIPVLVDDNEWTRFYASLLAIRREHIAPRLRGTRSAGASAIGESAVRARWRLGDGSMLTIAANFAESPLSIDPISAKALFASDAGIEGALRCGSLPRGAVAFLEGP